MDGVNKRQYVLIGGIVIVLAVMVQSIYPEFLSVQPTSGASCLVDSLAPGIGLTYFNLILLLGFLIIISYFKSESRIFQILALVLSVMTLLFSILSYIVIFSYPLNYVNNCGYGYSDQPLAIVVNIVLLLVGIALSAFGSYGLIQNRKTQKITKKNDRA